MTTHEVLVAARNLVAKGWTQKQRKRHHIFGGTSYCLSGAIGEAASEHYVSARDAFYTLGRVIGTHPIMWNDHPDRRKSEVLAAFDEAIRQTAPEPADPFLPAKHAPAQRIPPCVRDGHPAPVLAGTAVGTARASRGGGR